MPLGWSARYYQIVLKEKKKFIKTSIHSKNLFPGFLFFFSIPDAQRYIRKNTLIRKTGDVQVHTL